MNEPYDYKFSRFCSYIQTALLCISVLLNDFGFMKFQIIYGSCVFILVIILEEKFK